jgi:hypothetical protein
LPPIGWLELINIIYLRFYHPLWQNITNLHLFLSFNSITPRKKCRKLDQRSQSTKVFIILPRQSFSSVIFLFEGKGKC